MALAGSSLSGCALIGGAADGAWSGTKYVAKVVTYPVRALLRDAPEEETQFAAVESETVVETTTVAETQQVRAPKMTGSKKTQQAEMMAETIVEVKSSKVMGASTAAMPVPVDSRWTLKTPQTAAVQIKTETLGSQAMAMQGSAQTRVTETSYSQSPVQIVETVAVSNTQSMDVVTVGNVSWMRMDGAGSLEDWRTCDTDAGGFWSFDGLSLNGSINPAFENCMRSKDYVRDNARLGQRVAEMADTQEAAAKKPNASQARKLDPLP